MRGLFRKLMPQSIDEPGGSLDEWRERILLGVLRVTLVFGVVVYVPSVVASVRDRLWGVLIADTIGLAWAFRLALARSLVHRRRAIELVVVFYLIAVTLLVEVGPVSQIYLFAVPLFAAMLLGWQAALVGLVAAAVTLLVLGVLGVAHVSFAVHLTGSSLFQWSVVSLNFVFVALVIAAALATLLEGLASTIQRERALRVALEREQAELRASHERLRKEVEEHERARERATRLVTAVEQFSDGVAIADASDAFVYQNLAFRHLLGWRDQDGSGGIERLVSELQPPAAHLDELPDGVQTGLLRRVGRRGEDRQLDVTIAPVRQPDASLAGKIALVRDVSHERAIEARLRQAQKLEAIGTLAGGIAHDFNNILVAILGFTELARDALQADTEIHRDLTSVLEAGERARALVRQILTFSRQVEDIRRPIALRPVVKEVLKLMRASIPSTIEITQKLGDEGWMVIADPTQIHQVIMNLCTNAFHAMENGNGQLAVELDSVAAEAALVEGASRLAPGGEYLRITVADTGCGMDAPTMERIFDPFFTTKERGKGTGLGLATVLGVVTACEGDITVRSKRGEGSTFRVYLPRFEEPVSAVQCAEVTPPAGRGEHILFVDDEPSIRTLGRRVLTNLGYRVTTAENGLDALRELTANELDVDLVVTDQTMPGMTGIELAQAIREGHRPRPVILTSGLGELLPTEQMELAGIHAFVRKPFNIAELGTTVRAGLDGAG